jgi:hypothetical protein
MLFAEHRDNLVRLSRRHTDFHGDDAPKRVENVKCAAHAGDVVEVPACGLGIQPECTPDPVPVHDQSLAELRWGPSSTVGGHYASVGGHYASGHSNRIVAGTSVK